MTSVTHTHTHDPLRVSPRDTRVHQKASEALKHVSTYNNIYPRTDAHPRTDKSTNALIITRGPQQGIYTRIYPRTYTHPRTHRSTSALQYDIRE